MYCTHPSCMLVRTCKSHWKVGGYQNHLLFHSVWTAGAVLAWLPSPSLQSPCTSTTQGPHVHVNTICMPHTYHIHVVLSAYSMRIIPHTVHILYVRMCEQMYSTYRHIHVFIYVCTYIICIHVLYIHLYTYTYYDSVTLDIPFQLLSQCLCQFSNSCLHFWRNICTYVIA